MKLIAAAGLFISYSEFRNNNSIIDKFPSSITPRLGYSNCDPGALTHFPCRFDKKQPGISVTKYIRNYVNCLRLQGLVCCYLGQNCRHCSGWYSKLEPNPNCVQVEQNALGRLDMDSWPQIIIANGWVICGSGNFLRRLLKIFYK